MDITLHPKTKHLYVTPCSPYRQFATEQPSRSDLYYAVVGGDLDALRSFRPYWNIPICTFRQPGYGEIYTTPQLCLLLQQDRLLNYLLADPFTDVEARSSPSGWTLLMIACAADASLGVLSLICQRGGGKNYINAISALQNTALNCVPRGSSVYLFLRAHGALLAEELRAYQRTTKARTTTVDGKSLPVRQEGILQRKNAVGQLEHQEQDVNQPERLQRTRRPEGEGTEQRARERRQEAMNAISRVPTADGNILQEAQKHRKPHRAKQAETSRHTRQQSVEKRGEEDYTEQQNSPEVGERKAASTDGPKRPNSHEANESQENEVAEKSFGLQRQRTVGGEGAGRSGAEERRGEADAEMDGPALSGGIVQRSTGSQSPEQQEEGFKEFKSSDSPQRLESARGEQQAIGLKEDAADAVKRLASSRRTDGRDKYQDAGEAQDESSKAKKSHLSHHRTMPFDGGDSPLKVDAPDDGADTVSLPAEQNVHAKETKGWLQRQGQARVKPEDLPSWRMTGNGVQVRLNSHERSNAIDGSQPVGEEQQKREQAAGTWQNIESGSKSLSPPVLTMSADPLSNPSKVPSRDPDGTPQKASPTDFPSASFTSDNNRSPVDASPPSPSLLPSKSASPTDFLPRQLSSGEADSAHSVPVNKRRTTVRAEESPSPSPPLAELSKGLLASNNLAKSRLIGEENGSAGGWTALNQPFKLPSQRSSASRTCNKSPVREGSTKEKEEMHRHASERLPHRDSSLSKMPEDLPSPKNLTDEPMLHPAAKGTPQNEIEPTSEATGLPDITGLQGMECPKLLETQSSNLRESATGSRDPPARRGQEASTIAAKVANAVGEVLEHELSSSSPSMKQLTSSIGNSTPQSVPLGKNSALGVRAARHDDKEEEKAANVPVYAQSFHRDSRTSFEAQANPASKSVRLPSEEQNRGLSQSANNSLRLSLKKESGAGTQSGLRLSASAEGHELNAGNFASMPPGRTLQATHRQSTRQPGFPSPPSKRNAGENT
ncbi:hypothetical protein Efla_004844 [Eimeria flavescens]